MPVITLPDGSEKNFDGAVSVMDVANSIGPGLAKATLAGEVDGVTVDASFIMEEDAALRIITDRDDAGLEIIRHSSAHLMAQAVQRLFPKAQVTIGPVIDNGFFYDFAFERPFTMEDLQVIEAEMNRIVAEDLPVTRSLMERDAAIEFFCNKGEAYKAEIIADIPATEPLSLYSQGEFIDLCRGPHVPSTGKLKAVKLEKVAGAYWRGDSNNAMLQRIYGTAWANKKDLKAYLKRIEEAKKRDHRLIGKQMDLFHTQEEAPGMVFWHENGWHIWLAVESYIRDKLRGKGYQEVRTPQLVDLSLWRKSGHADKFSEEMFITSSENREFAIKPMNCPCHIQVYNKRLHSYRDLPLRMAEFGACHRNEPSGALHGLMRVRGFVQDDAHIFCTDEQVENEARDFIDLVYEVYKDFGFTDVIVKLSTRPDQRIGADEYWDRAEKALAGALDAQRIEWQLQPGEGAFYGPKIEFSLRDCLGRIWQCGTLQLDFFLPGRLGAIYVDAAGERRPPILLHRAILGSMERFIGVLLEHYAGDLPLWLAPRQAVVLTITEQHNEYAQKVTDQLMAQGFRVSSDLRNEKIGLKIRESTLAKVPYLLVVGDNEAAAQTVNVRHRSGQRLGSMALGEFSGLIQQLIESKSVSSQERE